MELHFFYIDLYFISNSVLCVFKVPKKNNTKKTNDTFKTLTDEHSYLLYSERSLEIDV